MFLAPFRQMQFDLGAGGGQHVGLQLTAGDVALLVKPPGPSSLSSARWSSSRAIEMSVSSSISACGKSPSLYFSSSISARLVVHLGFGDFGLVFVEGHLEFVFGPGELRLVGDQLYFQFLLAVGEVGVVQFRQQVALLDLGSLLNQPRKVVSSLRSVATICVPG